MNSNRSIKLKELILTYYNTWLCAELLHKKEKREVEKFVRDIECLFDLEINGLKREIKRLSGEDVRCNKCGNATELMVRTNHEGVAIIDVSNFCTCNVHKWNQKPNLTARELSKKLKINRNKEDAQESIDILTGKRGSNE